MTKDEEEFTVFDVDEFTKLMDSDVDHEHIKAKLAKKRLERASKPEPEQIWFTEFLNSTTKDIRERQAPYVNISGRHLDIFYQEDLIGCRNDLVRTFPWWAEIIDELLMQSMINQSVGKREFKIEPTILVGNPGVGKSRFARAFCDAFGIHSTTVNVAGMNHDQIFGVPVGYASGHASIMLDAIHKCRYVNPVIIMDEIEKVPEENKNGNIIHRLLGLLEKSEAEDFLEPLLRQSCNMSKVNWIFTANSVVGLPAYFLSRCKVLRLAAPGPEHLGKLIQSIRNDIIAEQGLHPWFYRSFDLAQHEALMESYKAHQSVRILARQVKKLMHLDQKMKMQ